MKQAKDTHTTTPRVARHRQKLATRGAKRVEVTVPANDAALVKALAGTLRSGGDSAERIRKALQPILSAPQANTGTELIEFFRNSPLVDAQPEFERDRTQGRSADVE